MRGRRPLRLLVPQLLISRLAPKEHAAIRQQRELLECVLRKIQIAPWPKVAGAVWTQVAADVVRKALCPANFHKVLLRAGIPHFAGGRGRSLECDRSTCWACSGTVVQLAQGLCCVLKAILAHRFVVSSAAYADIGNWMTHIAVQSGIVPRYGGEGPDQMPCMACQVVGEHSSIAKARGKDLALINAGILACPLDYFLDKRHVLGITPSTGGFILLPQVESFRAAII
mmetsp:Transcript_6005/g.14124  ORF Transcript_6005/g.14124 Transcript_6005/m.14124 type:complete len:227 (-) Transcript_6005:400-1080(-)